MADAAERQFLTLPIKKLRDGDSIADLNGDLLVRMQHYPHDQTLLTLKDSKGNERECVWHSKNIRIWF